MNFQPGQVIDGKYRLVKVIGEGGMGIVFEAENTRIKRKVALKVLKTEVAQNGDNVTRFEREAQAAARVGSRHIVEVLDLGDLPDGSRFIVMEHLEGESLGARLSRGGPIPQLRAVQIVVQMLEGLKRAHDAGIIHRDLKPENVFVAKLPEGEVVKLLDFGISKFSDITGLSMTRTGAMLGTPAYMSPEQVRGLADEVDHRVDIYAAGVILFEAIAGQLPYLAESLHDLLFRIGTERARSLRSVVATVDPELDAIVARALDRHPSSRYARAHDFQAALSTWLANRGQQEEVVPTMRGPELGGTMKIADLRPTPSQPGSMRRGVTPPPSSGFGGPLSAKGTMIYTPAPQARTPAPLSSTPAPSVRREPAAPTPAAWGAGPTSPTFFIQSPTTASQTTNAPAPSSSVAKVLWIGVACVAGLVAVGGGAALAMRTRSVQDSAATAISTDESVAPRGPVASDGVAPSAASPVAAVGPAGAGKDPAPPPSASAAAAPSMSADMTAPGAPGGVPFDSRKRETVNGRRLRTKL